MRDPLRVRLRNPRATSAALAASLLLISLHAGAETAKWKDPTDGERQIVEDAEKGLVGAVHLERLYEASMDSVRVYVRAKILSQSGFDVGTVNEIDEDARDIEGRTVSPSGKVTHLAKADIRTITEVRAAGVSLKRKAFTLPALEPGCFVEYAFREPGAYDAGWFYISFQEKYPVLFQEIRTPDSFPYYVTARNQNGVRIDSHSEKHVHIFSARDAPALTEEPYGLPTSERAAVLVFSWPIGEIATGSTYEYWAQAGRLLADVIKGKLVRPEKLKDRLAAIPELRDGTPPERLGAIYRYVRANVRNRSVLAAGETETKKPSKSNMTARDALKRGLGTPIDLATVFASLLRSNGWRFRMILVPDRRERLFHNEIPSLFQFDGLVVEVNDPKLSTPVYASFDHPSIPLGTVPWQYLGAPGFAVDPVVGIGEDATIFHPASRENASQRDWTVEIGEDGDARIVRNARLSGQFGLEARAAIHEIGRDAYEKGTRAQYEKLDPPGEIESIALENQETPENDLVETIRLIRKGVVQPLPGGRIEFSPLKVIGKSNPFTQRARTQPIIFPYPYLESDALKITLPAGYRLEGLPRPIEVRTDAGRYAVEIRESEGNSVAISRTFALDQFFGQHYSYPAYKILFETAARGDAGLSLVWKKVAAPKTESGP